MTCPRRDYEEAVIVGVTENHCESKSDTDDDRLSGVSRPVDVDSGLRKETRGFDPESNEAIKEYGADPQAGAKAISIQSMKSGSAPQKGNTNGNKKKSDFTFKCDLCQASCNSQKMLDAHLNGKAHKKKLNFKKSNLCKVSYNAQGSLETHLIEKAHQKKLNLIEKEQNPLFCNAQEMLAAHLQVKEVRKMPISHEGQTIWVDSVWQHGAGQGVNTQQGRDGIMLEIPGVCSELEVPRPAGQVNQKPAGKQHIGPGAGAMDAEQRQEIVREVLEDLIAPSDLARKYKISAHSIRGLVKKTGNTLPKQYNKSEWGPRRTKKTQSPQGSPKVTVSAGMVSIGVVTSNLNPMSDQLPQLPTAQVPPGQLEGMRPQVTTDGHPTPESCQIINGTTETDKTKRKAKNKHKKRKGRREREELKEAESENKRARVHKKRKEKELREAESLNRRARVDTAPYCLVCQQSGHEMSTKCATCLACGEKGHVRKDCDAPKVVKSEGENIEQNGNENGSSDKMEVNNDKLKHEEDTEENGISINKREEDNSEKKKESDGQNSYNKENGTTRESNPCSDAPRVDCSSSPPNEIEILHWQVANCVKKRLDMYMVGQAGTEPKHMKIKDSDGYTRLAKFFSHKLRAQIKETYEQYNRTMEGVAITADHKEQIKVEIDMYFDTQPVIV